MLENQGKGSTVCNLERSTLSTRGHARSPARRGGPSSGQRIFAAPWQRVYGMG